MKKIIVILIAIFVLMEGIAWWVFQRSERGSLVSQSETVTSEPRTDPPNSQAYTPSQTARPLRASPSPQAFESAGDKPNGVFPAPTTEVVNGRTERTIHMGVRQYVWEPSTITDKKRELVRLIIHNADVMHGLVIPELGVLNIDIPPDGAVIEFQADKVGTFEFFCSYYCGEGHIEMQGKVIIE